MTLYHVERKAFDSYIVVPHTPKKGDYQFLSKSTAKKHLKTLKEGHPKEMYRIVKEVTTYTHGPWE